jgi:hypothetical protein
MVAADTLGGLLQGVALDRGKPRQGRRKLCVRDLERADAGGIDAIEAARVLEHRRVAARAHRGDDFGHGRIDLRIECRFERDQARESRLEVGIAGR